MTETRSVNRAKDRIDSVADKLNVPDTTRTAAKQLLDGVHENTETGGSRMDVLGAASLSLACKNEGLPITPDIVSRTWQDLTDDSYGDFENKLVLRRLEKVKDTTGLNPPPTEPIDLIDGYRDSLGAPNRLGQTAKEILEDLMKQAPEEITNGNSPSGNAAGAFYLAAREEGLRQEYTQEDIAAVGEVSELTIRKRYKSIAEVLGGEPVFGDHEQVAVTDGTSTTLDESRDRSDSVERGNGSDDTASESSPREGRESTEERAGPSEETEDGMRKKAMDTVNLHLEAYVVLRREAEETEFTEAELLVDTLRDVTKQLVDGNEVERRDTPAQTVTVEANLPRRVEQFLRAEVEDPATEFETLGELASSAVLDTIDTNSEGNAESIRLRGDVLIAARQLVRESEEYDTVPDLLRGVALSTFTDESRDDGATVEVSGGGET